MNMLVMATVLLVSAQVADYVPEPQPCPSPLTVGCYYFPGHFSPFRWAPMRAAGFPVPVLGYYRDGEPEVSDWHITWAVEHGIDFFAFDWYYHYEQGESIAHNRALNDGFLKARYRDMMQFCLMWCNEGAEEHYTEDHMMTLARLLTEHYFCQPNHLKVEGDNLLIFSRPDHLIHSFGIEGTKAILAKMGAVSRAAGCGGLFPVSKGHGDQAMLKQAGFRAITAYNYPQAGMTAEELAANRAPYASMVSGMEAIWKDVTGTGVLPYIVPVSPGWDARPWYGDGALVRTGARPGLYYDMCMRARQYVDPDLNMVIAECWNEFGEGSYIEPTLQYGFGMLDAMRDAFCDAEPHHDDIVPASAGLTAPVFEDVPLPASTQAEAGANMLYNGGVEGVWGWVTFGGMAPFRGEPGRESSTCLVVRAGEGVKAETQMPVLPDRLLCVTVWACVPEDSVLTVQAALFQGTRWLGRYAPILEIAGTTDGQWRKLEARVAIPDPEAGFFNVEFVSRGGDCRVDDVDVRYVLPQALANP